MLRLEPGHRVEVACRLTFRPGEKLPMRLIARAPAPEAAEAAPDDRMISCPVGRG